MKTRPMPIDHQTKAFLEKNNKSKSSENAGGVATVKRINGSGTDEKSRGSNLAAQGLPCT